MTDWVLLLEFPVNYRRMDKHIWNPVLEVYRKEIKLRQVSKIRYRVCTRSVTNKNICRMVQVASISEQVLPVHIGLKDYKLLRKNVAGLHDYYLEPQRIKLTFLFDISYNFRFSKCTYFFGYWSTLHCVDFLLHTRRKKVLHIKKLIFLIYFNSFSSSFFF